MRQAGPALVVVGMSLLWACVTPVRPDSPPPVLQAVETSPAPAPGQVRPNGLRVLIREGGDAFVAALLFAGGPVNDPPNLPGLGEWMVESALLGTARRDPAGRSPDARALVLGGELLPVATGGVLGWMVTGPPAHAEALLTLLADVAMEPAFPATAMEIAAAQRRENLEAEGDEAISLAIAVAIGSAVGLDRPLWLRTSVGMLSRVTREDVARHWRRMGHPGASALVVRGASAGAVSPTLLRLDAWRASPLRSVDPAVCSPQGLRSHLVESDETVPERTLALFAARVPGRGAPGRPFVEAVLAEVGEEPKGPLEVALGGEQARRARPDLIDLGLVGGSGVSVLIGGTVGTPEDAVGDASEASRIISLAGSGSPPAAAWGVRATRRGLERMDPLGASIDDGTAMLYPADSGLGGTGGLPGPWQYAYVLIGSGVQREAASGLATPSIWSSDGRRLSAAPPVRCLQSRGPGG